MKKTILILFLFTIIFSNKIHALSIDLLNQPTIITTTGSAIIPDTENSSLLLPTPNINATTSQAVNTESSKLGYPSVDGSSATINQDNQTSSKTTTADTTAPGKPPVVVTPKPIAIIKPKAIINPLAQIKSSITYAVIVKKNKYFKIGEKVQIIKDKGLITYYIKNLKITAWVSKDVLLIPKDPETNKTKLQPSVIETYVNKINIKSKTPFLLWVDIDRQLLYVLKNNKLHKTFECATGTNKSPTLRGTFEITTRGNWFFSNSFKQGALNWMRFSGSYLFHSLPMNKNRQIVDTTLNERASHGCVRLGLEDVKWLYASIPIRTKVWIN